MKYITILLVLMMLGCGTREAFGPNFEDEERADEDCFWETDLGKNDISDLLLSKAHLRSDCP